MKTLPWLHPARAGLLLQALEQRILVIDGAMGTMIQRHGLQEADYRGERFATGCDAQHAHEHGAGCDHDLKGNNDLLMLTKPEVIAGVHTAYLEAGADLVETNTFNATSISQADYHLEHLVYELNKAGAQVARACCDAIEATTPDKPRFVFGVLGPTSRTASISPDVNDPHRRMIGKEAEVLSGFELVSGGERTGRVVFDGVEWPAVLGESSQMKLAASDRVIIERIYEGRVFVRPA